MDYKLCERSMKLTECDWFSERVKWNWQYTVHCCCDRRLSAVRWESGRSALSVYRTAWQTPAPLWPTVISSSTSDEFLSSYSVFLCLKCSYIHLRCTVFPVIAKFFRSCWTSCDRGRTICPAPVRRTLRPSSSPYTPYVCLRRPVSLASSSCGRREYLWYTRQTRHQTRIIL